MSELIRELKTNNVFHMNRSVRLNDSVHTDLDWLVTYCPSSSDCLTSSHRGLCDRPEIVTDEIATTLIGHQWDICIYVVEILAENTLKCK